MIILIATFCWILALLWASHLLSILHKMLDRLCSWWFTPGRYPVHRTLFESAWVSWMEKSWRWVAMLIHIIILPYFILIDCSNLIKSSNICPYCTSSFFCNCSKELDYYIGPRTGNNRNHCIYWFVSTLYTVCPFWLTTLRCRYIYFTEEETEA